MTRTRSSTARDREGGQILVLFVIALIAIIAMVGLVLDGGDTFAQRRDQQNGADLAAMAGANAYMNLNGNVVARTAAAQSAATAAALRNGYATGANGVALDVTVTLLSGGADVKVGLSKPHPNAFSRIVGQNTWNVAVDATATAGLIDTAVGAAPWTMSILRLQRRRLAEVHLVQPAGLRRRQRRLPEQRPRHRLDGLQRQQQRQHVRGQRDHQRLERRDRDLRLRPVPRPAQPGQPHRAVRRRGPVPVRPRTSRSRSSARRPPRPRPAAGPATTTAASRAGRCSTSSARPGRQLEERSRGYFLLSDFKSLPLTVGECTADAAGGRLLRGHRLGQHLRAVHRPPDRLTAAAAA